MKCTRRQIYRSLVSIRYYVSCCFNHMVSTHDITFATSCAFISGLLLQRAALSQSICGVGSPKTVSAASVSLYSYEH